jgi:hypothetical protein
MVYLVRTLSLCLQVDLGRINSLIAQNAGLKAMLEEEHLQLEVSCETVLPLPVGQHIVFLLVRMQVC